MRRVDETSKAARAHAAHDARIARMLPVLRDAHSVACETCTVPSCCYEVVAAYPEEAALAVAAARAAGVDLAERVAAWTLAAAGVDGPDPNPTSYFAARLPCPMLDLGTGRCLVYASRPLACRSHFVRGDPAACALPHADRPEGMRVAHVESRAAGMAVLGHGPTANFACLLVANIDVA